MNAYMHAVVRFFHDGKNVDWFFLMVFEVNFGDHLFNDEYLSDINKYIDCKDVAIAKFTKRESLVTPFHLADVQRTTLSDAQKLLDDTQNYERYTTMHVRYDQWKTMVHIVKWLTMQMTCREDDCFFDFKKQFEDGYFYRSGFVDFDEITIISKGERDLYYNLVKYIKQNADDICF